MMYSEFVEATNCKQNENNYKVFEALEQIYMSRDDITKEQIYAAAAGLLDNSKSPAEIEAENKNSGKNRRAD